MPWFTVEKWAEMIENIKTAFLLKWEEIKTSLSEKMDEIETKLREAWENIRKTIDEKVRLIKEKVEELLKKFNTLRDDASKAFDTMKNNIINAISPIIDKIKEFVQWVRDAIQAVRDFFSSGYDQVGSSAAKTSKASARSGVMAMAMQEVGIPSVADARSVVRNIPHLASGAVIRGGKPFAAILGDQPAGQTNVEAPLPLFEKAVENVLERRGYNNDGTTVNIALNYDGETFARLSLRDIFAEAARQGYDVDLLGWNG